MNTELTNALELVGDYLTENNAHFARALLDWIATGETYPHLDQELELAYQVGRKVLEITQGTRLAGATCPNFEPAILELQDYTATIGATPAGQR